MIDEEEWEEDLIWCPTQIYRKVFINDIEFTLYLRWRWMDPFQFHIVCNPRLQDLFQLGYHYDLFDFHKIYNKDDEYKKAEKDADKLWETFYKPMIIKKLKENPEEII